MATVTNTSDPFGGLEGADRDAAVALGNLFSQFGIGSLSGRIVDFIRKGYSSDTIAILLQDTPEYKQRFSANDVRVKKGLPVLTPQEYLSTEESFRQLMQQAGLPVGFYDQPTDFTKWIENDVAPTEVKQRLDEWTQFVNSADSDTLNYFKKFYSTGDLVAYAIDPTRTVPLLHQKYAAAEIGGAAAGQGLGLDQATADRLAAQGVTQQQAQAGFGFIGQERGVDEKLSQIYGGDAVTQQDLVQEVFDSNAGAAEKRRKLVEKEAGTFGGSSGVGKGALGTASGGQI